MLRVRILVDQGCYELLNMGDVAMLQSCVRRLSHQWPDAEIMVIAHEFADLATYCPDAIAVGRTSGQELARLLPRRYRPVWQSTVPYLCGRLNRRRVPPGQPRTAVQAVQAADVVVAAGGGYVTDTWRWHATGVLGILSLAQRLGKPTAMFGQGIGPIRQRALRLQARAVLPKLAVLALREGRMGRDLALSLGVQSEAVTVTGDDAMELIGNDMMSDGYALGINMRVAGYAGVSLEEAAVVGDVAGQAAAAYDVPLLALPVSRYGADADLDAIRRTLPQGRHHADVVLRDLATPRDLAAATAECRAIITGSYHAAVFGLAQGVPTVCLPKSPYYDGKFAGLSDLFPGACFVVPLGQPNLAARLRAAIDQAWQLPVPLRSASADAAARLREEGRAAYARFRVAVEKNL
jgi:colanic acid/amylovoran biosynthesis protein